jgi:hypothetical protein
MDWDVNISVENCTSPSEIGFSKDIFAAQSFSKLYGLTELHWLKVLA